MGHLPVKEMKPKTAKKRVKGGKVVHFDEPAKRTKKPRPFDKPTTAKSPSVFDGVTPAERRQIAKKDRRAKG